MRLTATTLIVTHALLAGCASSSGSASDSESLGPASTLPPGLEGLPSPRDAEITVVGVEEEARVADPNQAELEPIDPAEAKRRMAEADLRANELLDRQLHKSGHDYFFPIQKQFTYNGLVVGSNFEEVCWMTSVQGRIKSSPYPAFRVGLNYYDSTYVVPGSNNPITVLKDNTQMGGVIYCVSRSHFSTPEGFVPYQQTLDYGFIWHVDSGIGCDERNTFGTDWYGNFALMLTGIGYDFNDRHDKVGVNQSSSMTSKNSFWLEQQHSPCRSVGYVNPVALRNNSVAKFRGPSGTGTAAQAGEFYWSTTGGSFIGDTGLNPANYGCYFSFIAGNFSSDNEYLSLVQENNRWRLYIGAASDGGVRASVRCFPYAQ